MHENVMCKKNVGKIEEERELTNKERKLYIKEMKDRMHFQENGILDESTDPVITTGRSFAIELTNFSIKMNNLYGTEAISAAHVKSNIAVRNAIIEALGIAPEDILKRDN